MTATATPTRATGSQRNHILTAMSFRDLGPDLEQQVRDTLPDMTWNDAVAVLDLINAHPKTREYQP